MTTINADESATRGTAWSNYNSSLWGIGPMLPIAAKNVFSIFCSSSKVAFSAASSIFTKTSSQLGVIASKFSKRNGYPLFNILRDSISDALLVDLQVCLLMALANTSLSTIAWDSAAFKASPGQFKSGLLMELFAETTAAIGNYAIRGIFREGDSCTMLGGVIAGFFKYSLRDYMNSGSVYAVTNALNKTNLIEALITVGTGGVNILAYELYRSKFFSSTKSKDIFKLLAIVSVIEVGVDGFGQGLVKAALVSSTLTDLVCSTLTDLVCSTPKDFFIGIFTDIVTGICKNAVAAVAVTACIRYIDTPCGDSVKGIISRAGTFVSRICSDMAEATVSR